MEAIKKLHGRLIVTGLYRDAYSISRVLSSYAISSAYFNDARLVLHQIEQPHKYIWNSMIRGSSQSDQPNEAFSYYNQMRQNGSEQNHLTFIFIVKACERIKQIEAGRQIHGQIIKLSFLSHLFVSNALIHMYAFCGAPELARKIFDETPERDLVSWNSLICGYGQNKRMRDVLDLFEAMQSENVIADAVTLVKVLLACCHSEDWNMMDKAVKYMRDNNVKMDIYLGNALIDIYGRRGCIELARRTFDEMSERNVVSYNTMIMSCTKAGELAAARKLFNEMLERDVISWSSIINGYSQAKQFTRALELFNEMMVAEVKPDEITLASVLSACAHLGALDIGKGIHDYIRKNNIRADIYIGNSLINMYCKSACIAEALEVFEEMKQKDTVTWTSIISGMAVNGFANTALEFFGQMLDAGIKPSGPTFIAILHACTHNGLVDEGVQYFQSMREYRIEPDMKHYGCIVDLLSRSGKLEEAYNFIEKMPVAPDPVIWRILLSACKQHGNVEMAEIVTKKLLYMDPSNSGNYVLLSTTYAGANRWDESMKVRDLMEESNVQKEAACSSIGVDSKAQESTDISLVPG
ncbi:pentatricopeptide repeat-containing protein At2g22410, mitochondrial-like [Aristolochia californica]|uniref:pentatricopeptide repeat-containing protein At2g22410, mitochondrial-like n=1 Tax=Aristolochia californica TaxID=171875 RepID=UPI0035DEB89C